MKKDKKIAASLSASLEALFSRTGRSGRELDS